MILYGCAESASQNARHVEPRVGLEYRIRARPTNAISVQRSCRFGMAPGRSDRRERAPLATLGRRPRIRGLTDLLPTSRCTSVLRLEQGPMHVLQVFRLSVELMRLEVERLDPKRLTYGRPDDSGLKSSRSTFLCISFGRSRHVHLRESGSAPILPDAWVTSRQVTHRAGDSVRVTSVARCDVPPLRRATNASTRTSSRK